MYVYIYIYIHIYVYFIYIYKLNRRDNAKQAKSSVFIVFPQQKLNIVESNKKSK